jgi:hypothetical protein
MKNLVARIPRKLLFVILGITVLGGGSGAAAVYVGADRLLGPPYSEVNGPACSTIATTRIKKADRYWIRKYVTTDEKVDGLSRLKTALRVAQTVQRAEKSDLVQVTVLDAAGPTDRARMRGRAIGAQVVYIPDLNKVPEGAVRSPISAYYVDSAADTSGQFWGLRIDLPQEDAEAVSASLTDHADCLDPIVEGQVAHAAPAAKGAGAGHGSEAESGKAGDTDEAASHGDAEPAAEHAQEAGGDASDHGDQGAAPQAAEEQGFLDQVKGMIFGDMSNEPAEAAHDEAKAEVAPASGDPEPPQAPRTPAEGGKRWSNASEADEIRSEDSGADHAAPETAEPEDGVNEADAAGAAWLEKFRARQAGTATDGAKPAH